MIVTFVAGPSLLAQTPPSTTLQVGHDSWTFQDGAPEEIFALAQTDDGFLWLGSETGLVRFDGRRFEPFRSPFGDQLLSTVVYALFAPPSGGLWIGYRFGGFSFVKHGRVTNYETVLGAPTGTVLGFAQDRDGILWAATANGLWRFNRGGWEHVGAEWNAPKEGVLNIGFDSDGILWALSGVAYGSRELVFLLPSTTQFKVAAKSLFVRGFTLNADGAVVTEPAPNSLADDSRDHSNGQPHAYPVLRTHSFQVVDKNNAVWMLHQEGHLVMRVSAKERLSDAIKKPSPSNSETYEIDPYSAAAQLVDREGNIWFGTPTGLHRLFYSPLTKLELPLGTFALAPGDDGAIWIAAERRPYLYLYRVFEGKVDTFLKVKSAYLNFIYRAPDKALWLGGDGGIWRLAGRNLVRIVVPPELAKQTSFLQAITEDQRGGMWISFGSRGLYRLAQGAWTAYGGRADLPKTRLLTELTDSLGRVWFGYEKNQLAVLDGDLVRVFGPHDGVKVGNITAIYGRGAETWIGGEFGLQQVDSGRIRSVSAFNRELLRGISGIIETVDGDLWLNGLSGIVHLPRLELSEALRDPSYQLKGHRIGRRAGLPGFPPQLRPLQTAIEGSDGKLWFAGTRGVAWLDPAHVRQEAPPPLITIESLSADGKSYELVSPLTLPAAIGSVQIDYAAVSLSGPEGNHFRYKLQEIDKGWNEAAAATPVTYRNLPPGSYHFSVEAPDANGAWSGAPTNLAFTVLPAFYQTFWFRGLGVILFVTMLTGLYQLRLRQVARQYSIRLELQQARTALAHRQRVSMLGGLAASLAHEIRQPMAAMTIDATACLRALADDRVDVHEARRAASRMVKEATWADEIITRTGALYRKDATEREDVDVNAVIREMAVLLQQEAATHAITIRTALEDGLPVVIADRVQLQQVFMNLMLNAIEAMKDTGGDVTIMSAMREPGELLIAVSDTGVGLPTDTPDTIFDAFVTTKPHGTGMGLAITRSIVDAHGGRLWASANDPHGAIFQFTLPGQQDADAARYV
jgi:signal transduction histidine kinase/ligand-binding sensor domain-containing protein